MTQMLAFDQPQGCLYYHSTVDTRCTGMNVKVRKTRNKDQVPREKP